MDTDGDTVDEIVQENAKRIDALVRMKRKRSVASNTSNEHGVVHATAAESGLLQTTLAEVSKAVLHKNLPARLFAQSGTESVNSVESALKNTGLMQECIEGYQKARLQAHQQSKRRQKRNAALSVANTAKAEQKEIHVRDANERTLVKPPPPREFVRRDQENNVELRSKMRMPPSDFTLPVENKLFFRRAKVRDHDDEGRWMYIDINSSTLSSAGFIMNETPSSSPEVSYSVIHAIYETDDGTRWAEHSDFYDLDDLHKQAQATQKSTSELVDYTPSDHAVEYAKETNSTNASSATENGTDRAAAVAGNPSSRELFKVQGRRHTPLVNIETDDFRIHRKSEYDQLDENDKGDDAFYWRYEFNPHTLKRSGTENHEPVREKQ